MSVRPRKLLRVCLSTGLAQQRLAIARQCKRDAALFRCGRHHRSDLLQRDDAAVAAACLTSNRKRNITVGA